MVKLKEVTATGVTRTINGIVVAHNQNEMQAAMTVFFKGFPDLIITLDNTTICKNTAFINWTFIGTNTDVFGETAATGKKVKISGCSSIKFNEEFKIIDETVFYNELELLQQLGYTFNKPIVE
jgi:hypothetical protein